MSEQQRLLKLHDDLITFREETLKLVKRKGHLTEAVDFELTPANEEDIVEASCLKDLDGFSFFTLGPVYVLANVPYSLLDQFAAEVDKDVPFLTVDVGTEFMGGLDVMENGRVVGSWNDKIHAVPTEQLDAFTDFMTSQVLKQGDKVFGIVSQDAMIQDPVHKRKSGPSPDYLMRIRVFSAHTYRGVVLPYIDVRSGKILFKTKPASHELKQKISLVMKAMAGVT